VSDYEYAGEPGMGFAGWVDQTQTPAGQGREHQLAQDDLVVSAYLAYKRRCRDRAALVAWARTPEAQDTAARAETIGLFDPVSPDAGPQCPSKRPADPDRYVEANPAPEALRRPSSAGNQQDGPDAVAPRPGRWRRLCRWISE